jgi:ribosome-associated toxin RatA of RatAB toxin-antitoxin module
MLQKVFRNKNISKKKKSKIENTIKDKTLTYASETWTITERDRKQINFLKEKYIEEF